MLKRHLIELTGVLHSLGLHDIVIKSTQALVDNPTAWINVNQGLSNSFTLEKCLRHGCALSPLLIVLYLDPLAQYIRRNKDSRAIIWLVTPIDLSRATKDTVHLN